MTITAQGYPRVPAGLFVCPACRAPLTWDSKLACRACEQRYLSADGTPCFNDRGAYHGPIPPKQEMHRVLDMARRDGYRTVLEGYLKTADPELFRYLTEVGRAGGLTLLNLRGHEQVLDFGCSFGVLSLQLARRAKLVVALDVTHEKLQFLDIVRGQDCLDHLVPVCNGDPVRLPFSSGYFDWVVLNAVFEYLPQAIDAPDVRTAHLLALREFHRVLRPGGRIYVATKNRFSYAALLNSRILAFLPRCLANRLAGWAVKNPDRHVIHGFRGYRGLFRDAGFTALEIHWALPTLWYPAHFVRLTEPAATTIRELRRVPLGGRAKRTLWLALAAAGLLPLVAPNYFILARKDAT